MMRQPRVFYIGMITTDAYGRAIGDKTYAGAATRKMLLVARALRSVGHRPIVVSLPFVGTRAARASYGRVLTSDGGVLAVFLATLRSRVLRKLVGPLVLAGFAWYRVDRRDSVIVYNHAVEYIPALVVLRIKGVHTVQDIEDAPTAKERGARGLANRLSFAVTFRLTIRRKMVVANHVAEDLGLEDYVVVRGVAAQEVEAKHRPDVQKWDRLRAGQALKVHFGGTLIAETGIDLFCGAVEQLAEATDQFRRPIIFAITGVGELDKIRDLKAKVGTNAKIGIELQAELGKTDYLALVDGCHVSLSLKRPGSEMGRTTFPSKVIEITASGLALVSARLGDVVEIFDEESAFFLDTYKPADLAALIAGMAGDPEHVERVARAGQAACKRSFSPETVGHDMMRLLQK